MTRKIHELDDLILRKGVDDVAQYFLLRGRRRGIATGDGDLGRDLAGGEGTLIVAVADHAGGGGARYVVGEVAGLALVGRRRGGQGTPFLALAKVDGGHLGGVDLHLPLVAVGLLLGQGLVSLEVILGNVLPVPADGLAEFLEGHLVMRPRWGGIGESLCLLISSAHDYTRGWGRHTGVHHGVVGLEAHVENLLPLGLEEEVVGRHGTLGLGNLGGEGLLVVVGIAPIGVVGGIAF